MKAIWESLSRWDRDRIITVAIASVGLYIGTAIGQSETEQLILTVSLSTAMVLAYNIMSILMGNAIQ